MTNSNLSVNNGYYLTLTIRLCADVSRVRRVSTRLKKAEARFADYITRDDCSAPVRGADPYARNARTHSDQQVAQIAASMREFGFTNPVLIDEEDGIIAGHGRVLAAHLLGLDEVQVKTEPRDRRGYPDFARMELAMTADDRFDLQRFVTAQDLSSRPCSPNCARAGSGPIGYGSSSRSWPVSGDPRRPGFTASAPWMKRAPIWLTRCWGRGSTFAPGSC